MTALRTSRARAFDILFALLLFVLPFALYLRTLAPTLAFVFDDSAEFQLLAWRAAIAHPTGYPFYSLLLTLVAHLFPFGDVAFRTNLFSAFCASLALVFVYLAARQLPITNPLSSFIAALTFALGETFWSQAIITEVYALHTLLTAAIIFLALRLQRFNDSPIQRINDSRTFTALAFLVGLSLTHHRMSALNLPALVIFVLLLDKNIWKNLRALARPLLAFVTPFALFLYLPLRGLTNGSLDGTYQNTVAGFFDWVTGASYTVFLTQNPFNEQRAASFFVNLFASQFTWLGVALALVGFFALLLSKNSRRAWVLLTLAFLANFLFALNYRVADIDVFFIPSFLFASFFIASGIAVVLRPFAATAPSQNENQKSAIRNLKFFVSVCLGGLLLFVLPYLLFRANYETVRLDDKYDVSDEGRAQLAQPLPENATIIGILGEMTRLRYFQETQGLQPNVETIAADKEDARLKAIGDALENNRAVFLTRKLSNVEKKYSLSSYGSLIRVSPTPSMGVSAERPYKPLNENFDGVTLVGYDLDTSRLQDSPAWHLDNGRQVRVTLYWRVDKKITNDRFVSIKLLDANGTRAAQLDRHPVLDAYPTTAWRVGEYIADAYDVPIFAGVPAGNYSLDVTLYDPDSGHVHGEKVLQTISLDADAHHHRADPEILGVDKIANDDFGGIELVGYALDTSEPYAAGDAIPLTFLWLVSDADAHEFQVELVDATHHSVQSQQLAAGYAARIGTQYLRQDFSFALPPKIFAGTYELRLALAGSSSCDSLALSPCSTLGQIQIAK